VAGADLDEWVAGYVQDGDGRALVYGLLAEPDVCKPTIARFGDGNGGWSPFMVVQRIFPGVYINCVCGTTFYWEDEQVVPYSPVSRTVGIEMIVSDDYKYIKYT
jgi:hypothetical protein